MPVWLRAGDTIFGSKKINSLDARVAIAAGSAGILKSSAELAVVEILHIPDRKQPHAILGIVNYVVNQV